jgi:hypothetical protein
VVVASYDPPKPAKSRNSRRDNSIDLFGPQRLDAGPAVAPAFMPASFGGEDPLGPLILRTGFESSYAPTDHFSQAQRAATELAATGDRAVIVQIGMFGDRANAERVAAHFASFGRVLTKDVPAADRTLYSVRVVVDKASVRPEAVLAAANAAGLADAFVVSR